MTSVVSRSAAVLLLAAVTVVAPNRAVFAARAECGSVTPAAISATAQPDGRYTPIVLVHGFLSSPESWREPVRYATAGPTQLQNPRSLLSILGGQTGAAVYTVDYRLNHMKWFEDAGGGGDEFLRVADCVLARPDHQGHKLVVVGHSMGGLIARWAMTDAPGAAARRARTELVISIGTPYEGSLIADAAVELADTVALGAVKKPPPDAEKALVLLHALAAACSRLDNSVSEPCQRLAFVLDLLATVAAFDPDSRELRSLSPWPKPGTAGPISVLTIGTNSVVVDAGGLFRKRTETEVGDVVVTRASATAGPSPERVVECRYTTSAMQAASEWLLDQFGLDYDDTDGHAIMALLGGCFHMHQTTLLEVTYEVTHAVSEALRNDATTSPSPSPSPTAPPTGLAATDVDWPNASYRVNCETPTPRMVEVTLVNGVGQVPKEGGSAGSTYDIWLGAVASGDLTGDGRPEVALVLSCHASDTSPNFILWEVQVFADGPTPLGRIDVYNSSPDIVLPDPDGSLSIGAGVVDIGIEYRQCGACEGEYRTQRWRWVDGSFLLSGN